MVGTGRNRMMNRRNVLLGAGATAAVGTSLHLAGY
jgi:hypothetical protein